MLFLVAIHIVGSYACTAIISLDKHFQFAGLCIGQRWCTGLTGQTGLTREVASVLSGIPFLQGCILSVGILKWPECRGDFAGAGPVEGYEIGQWLLLIPFRSHTVCHASPTIWWMVLYLE